MFRIARTATLGLIIVCAVVLGMSRSTYASEMASN